MIPDEFQIGVNNKVRLKSINIYSAYLGNEDDTKTRTRLLRQDTDFLDDEFAEKVRFYDNDFCRQLNIACDEKATEMSINSLGVEGYPTVTIPFDFSVYESLTDTGRKIYWVKEIKKVFNFLSDKMNGKPQKISDYIEYLESKYID